MSKLDELLQGVDIEWKTLSEIGEISGAGVDKKIIEGEKSIKLLNYMDIYRNKYITKDIPSMVVSASDIKIKQCNVLKGDIFFTPSSEVLNDIGKSSVALENIVGVVYSYHIMRLRLSNPNIITSMYVNYMLGSDNVQNQINKKAKGLTRFGLTKTQWQQIVIPIPCPDNPEKSLEIQQEIVRFLDELTSLTNQLTTELETERQNRKKQFEFFREQLFRFEEDENNYVALGELAENLDSKRKPITSSQRKPGKIPYYGASGIVDYVEDYIFDGDYLLVSEDGANLLARSTPIAFSISGKNWVNNHAHVLKFETKYERLFVEYYLNSIDLAPYITGAAQPKLNKKNLNSIKIPNPSLEEQERIVTLLDQFDATHTAIEEEITKEIKLRTQQYEYYREKLLSFPQN